ncbi:MAG TPA: hypothetical protein VFE94_02915 [Candidatus Paceibacterota bacterium]|nr:hypothetical protein [Candidatus Paceibacterota bacterium]
METTDIGELKTRLEKEKERLESELASFATKDPNVKGDWDSKYPRIPGSNLEEAADEVEEYSTRLHLEHSLETKLKDINDALDRIEKGTWGTCQNCGNPIATERLQISPEAATCGKCK